MTKIVIYTEKSHDQFLLSILEYILNTRNSEDSIYVHLIIDKPKYKRLENVILTKYLIVKKTTLLNRFDNFGIKFLDGLLLRYPLNFLLVITNIIKLKFKFRLVNPTEFYVLEYYNSMYIRFIAKSKLYSENKLNKLMAIHSIQNIQKQNKITYKLFNMSKEYIVMTENIKMKLGKITNKPIHVIPYSVPNSKLLNERINILDKLPKNHVVVTVTGNIDKSRKNYYKIIDYFSQIPFSKYKLILLGPVVSKNIIDYAETKNINFIYFSKYVENTIFQDTILHSHYLLTFISNKNYENNKTSGIVFDAIQHGLPLISDSNYFDNIGANLIFIKNLEQLKEIIMNFQLLNYINSDGINSVNVSRRFLEKQSN